MKPGGVTAQPASLPGPAGGVCFDNEQLLWPVPGPCCATCTCLMLCIGSTWVWQQTQGTWVDPDPHKFGLGVRQQHIVWREGVTGHCVRRYAVAASGSSPCSGAGAVHAVLCCRKLHMCGGSCAAHKRGSWFGLHPSGCGCTDRCSVRTHVCGCTCNGRTHEQAVYVMQAVVVPSGVVSGSGQGRELPTCYLL